MADKGRRDESDAPFPLQGGRLIQRVQRALERLHLAGPRGTAPVTVGCSVISI